ncbi:MAG: hypothetical protein ACERK1_02330 [Anaerolineales bacterium]
MRKLLYIPVYLLISLSIASCTPANEFPTGEFFMPLGMDYRARDWWGVDGVTFNFYDDGTFTVTDTAGVQRISGTYVIDGDKYTETSSDRQSCIPAGPATYRWRFDDGYLTFIGLGEDECLDRMYLMGEKYLIKQE